MIWGRRGHRDRGAVAIEVAIIAPALLVLLVLIAAAGRLAGAHTSIDSAANNAARAASISRSSGEARSQAVEVARTALSEQGMSCPSPEVSVDTSGLSAPVGQVGVVSVSVTCAVPLSDLVGLPMSGSRTVTAQSSSVVDAYRMRGAP